MKESVSIVFIVIAKGYTVSSILGAYVEESMANAVRDANAELWVSCTVEPWVLDYSAEPKSIVEAVLGKSIVPADDYNVGDMVLFDDGITKGYGEIESIATTNPFGPASPLIIYQIACEPGAMTDKSGCAKNEERRTIPMYHSEIKGAAK